MSRGAVQQWNISWWVDQDFFVCCKLRGVLQGTLTLMFVEQLMAQKCMPSCLPGYHTILMLPRYALLAKICRLLTAPYVASCQHVADISN